MANDVWLDLWVLKPPPAINAGGGSFYPLPDVPSPGELLHPGAEREFLCQCFQ